MLRIIDPVFYSAVVHGRNDKVPPSVTVGKEYTVIGYVESTEPERHPSISHWIVNGDNGIPVYLWPATVKLIPHIGNDKNS